ncbi:MAG: FliI/YscN family ATPase [Myxococcota bacterium]
MRVALRIRGRVIEVTGSGVRVRLPAVGLGQMLSIQRGRSRVQARVVGFKGHDAWALPYAEPTGLGVGAEVVALDGVPSLRCSESVLGRILDGRGRPADGGRPIDGPPWAIDRSPPDPLHRRPIEVPLFCGVRAIDGLLTLGRGQRIGLFAEAGVGKTALLAQMARYAEADVVVCGLVGERSREIRDFVEHALEAKTRSRTVTVYACSDSPAVMRRDAASVATSVAEWFRARGANVLLLMDSLTRVARAQREIGLAAREPPTRQGYPPSVFAELPRLVERAGTDRAGTITALYTVLVAADATDDPVADEIRGLLDGHIVLNRSLAERCHFPAIDILASVSRLMRRLVSEEHAAAAAQLRKITTDWRDAEELVRLGAYVSGSDPDIDRAIQKHPEVLRFLRQSSHELTPADETRRLLLDAAS